LLPSVRSSCPPTSRLATLLTSTPRRSCLCVCEDLQW
jgi:hypothetical protein